MRICGVTCCTNFKSGKVHVYSDFDGTYCPAKHSSLHNPAANPNMKEYCTKISDFFKATDGNLHFHVTTGRTFGEYKAVSELLRERQFELPLPETFIAKNGSDEYVKINNQGDFYKAGEFPFKYDKTNKLKQENIHNLTNWDGEKLKDFIKNMASKKGFSIVEADSENSVKDYGKNSLFSEGKLNPEEWKGKVVTTKNAKLGLRNDGNLKINIVFPPNYNENCKELVKDIENHLKQNHVEYNMRLKSASNHNHYRKSCEIMPLIDGNKLTKLYDTKEALKRAIKEHDMIIVAGDGSNDLEMLNPLEYIEQKDWNKYKKHSKFKEFYECNMYKKLELLQEALNGKMPQLKQELENNGFIEQIKKMPIYSIVIRNDDSELEILSNIFGDLGKVIEVEKGDLDKGIKSAIEKHALNNTPFREGMSSKFKTYIMGVSSKANNIKKTTLFTLCAVLAGVSCIIFAKNRNKSSENKS